MSHEEGLARGQLLEALAAARREAAHWRSVADEERKLREAKLLEDKEFLLAVLENISNGIVACDAEGVLTLFNRATREFHGLPEAPIPADRWAEHYDLYLADGETPMTQKDIPLFRALQGETIENTEMVIAPKGGKARTLLASGRALRNAEGAKIGAVVSMNDVTESKAIREQLNQAMKMEAIGRLAGGVAHDFNNLLTVILGYGELVLGELPPGHPHMQPITHMTTAAVHAASLTQQLLAFSRQQMISPEVTSLNDVVDQACKLLSRILREDIDLQVVLAPSLGRVLVDPSQVLQVVMNLAVNARDSMAQGGNLKLETADVVLDEDYVATQAELTPGAYVTLAVSDNGTGMSEATRSRIFEPFFTTKPKGQGTGFGLATVYGVVKQNRGHVSVESELGVGTTFRVYLPRVEDPCELPRDDPSDSDLGGGEVVLVVEDEDGVRDLVMEILRNQGYTVLSAASGEEALEVARAHGRAIDLLLSDVVMTGMNGHDLARQIKAVRPETRVLYMSGYARSGIAQDSVLQDPASFVAKPFSVRELSQRVRAFLDGPT